MTTPVGSPNERLQWRCSRVVHAASTLLVLVQPYLHVFDTTSGKPVRAAMSALADEVSLCKKQHQLLPAPRAPHGVPNQGNSAAAAGPSGAGSAPAPAPRSSPAGFSAPPSAAPSFSPSKVSADHPADAKAKAADSVSRVLRLLAPPEWWSRFRAESAQCIEGARDPCGCGRNKAHTREVCASHRAGAYRRHLQHLLDNAAGDIPEAITVAYDGVCSALVAGQSLQQAEAAYLPAPKPMAGKRERANESSQAAGAHAVPMDTDEGGPQPTASARPTRKAARGKRVRPQAQAPVPAQDPLIGQVLQQLAELQRGQAAQAAALAAVTTPPAYGVPPTYGARFTPPPHGFWAQ
jgi:hypothetical protein